MRADIGITTSIAKRVAVHYSVRLLTMMQTSIVIGAQRANFCADWILRMRSMCVFIVKRLTPFTHGPDRWNLLL
ncbi:hypothetical protein BN2475_700095 [Paraburkholderia ribeironis]|uniref:Uncharacterized protein n=1 Tax=Paraburkholderia ribeironis TaxID=1247936 RepID=A0A1N7SHU1_9BURK|nr:hypothetical protein BN2475_700095 [Paraburkholderia ribeironis]